MPRSKDPTLRRHAGGGTTGTTAVDPIHGVNANRVRKLLPDVRRFDLESMLWASDVRITPREKATLMAVAGHPGVDLDQLERATGMTVHTVGAALDVLAHLGYVHRVEGGYALERHTVPLDKL